MITKQEYEHYKRLVDEYEQAEYEENMRMIEDDFKHPAEDEEEEDEDEYDPRYGCTCGAWKHDKQGRLFHVADCCCGAE